MMVTTGTQVDISKDCDKAIVKYEHCENDPEKIKHFRGEPQRKYFEDNREYWVYDTRGTRGILIGAIIPLPLYIPWTNNTTFEFEKGKRVRTTSVKAESHGLLCGYIFGIEHFDWTCMTGKDW